MKVKDRQILALIQQLARLEFHDIFIEGFFWTCFLFFFVGVKMMGSDCGWGLGGGPNFSSLVGGLKSSCWVLSSSIGAKVGYVETCVDFDVAHFSHHLCLEIYIQELWSHGQKV